MEERFIALTLISFKYYRGTFLPTTLPTENNVFFFIKIHCSLELGLRKSLYLYLSPHFLHFKPLFEGN